MSARISDQELARYYDGELSAEQAERVERMLRDDPHAERVLGGLEQLGDVVRAWADERGKRHDDIADGVMQRIAEERMAQHGTGNVTPLRRLRRSAVIITGALSLAAAAAVLIRAGEPAPQAPRPGRALVARPVTPPAPVQSAAAVEEAEDEPVSAAAAIESVDFGTHGGSIFVVAGTEGSVPVVWLLDEAAEPGARMQPL